MRIPAAEGRGEMESLGNLSGPLNDNDLNRRLEALAARAGVSMGKILIRPWQDHHARILGLSARNRRVVLNKALLEQYSPEEVEAVFAHEIGHVRFHHRRWILAFLVANLILALLLFKVRSMMVFPAYLLGVFVISWLIGRRFELEADSIAVDLVGIGPCDSFLARSQAAGPRRGYHHPSYARRRKHLAIWAENGPSRRIFERNGKLFRFNLLALLLGCASLAAFLTHNSWS